ncbi:SLBB domain-containing protein [Candidatus Poribacteria bacterium]|nr:SLBB domain-containing protein [Candidatus Poribacteria bacterium]
MIQFFQSLRDTKTLLCFLQTFYFFILLLLTASSHADVYHIRNGDTLLIAVIGQPEFTHSVKVRDDGRISYFGGDFDVSEKTTEQVNTIIKDFLKTEKLVNNPVIMVSVISEENKIYVGGAVNTPGRYSISPESDVDLFRAISLAGGMTENADRQQVHLIRHKSVAKSDNNAVNLIFESYDLSKVTENLEIRVNSNDLVYVHLLSEIEVQGEVKIPGKLFIKGKSNVPDILTRAGGFTKEANVNALVHVTRDGTLTEFTVSEEFWNKTDSSPDISLNDGDVLFVPNRFKIEPIYVTGYVRTPGAQSIEGPVSVQKAIAIAGGLDDAADRKTFHIHRKDGKTEVHKFQVGSDTILIYPGDILEIHKKYQVNWVLISTLTATAIGFTSFLINVLGE